MISKMRTFDFRKTIMRKRRSGKPDSGFYETVMLKHSTPEQSGRGAGKCLDYTKGSTHPNSKTMQIAGC